VAIAPPPRRSASQLSPAESAALARQMAAGTPRQDQARIDANARASIAQTRAASAARENGYSPRYAANAAAQAKTATPETLRAWANGRDPVYAAAARAHLTGPGGPGLTPTASAPRAASVPAARASES
jgi:hypothetical protein